MRSLLRLLSAMSRIERIVLGVLFLVLLGSLLMLTRKFLSENTIIIGARGGTYIEGSVGSVQPMNPWFVASNDVTHDIVALVFAGLMKYDPETGRIIDDLATVTASADFMTYTAVLKPKLVWHDSDGSNPHPITADDVVFTYHMTQQEGFQNPILQQNFRGVTVEKVDERTVRFKLKKPYAFFTTNMTLGLLPKRAFEGISADKLNESIDFGLHPIGAGPYAFQSILETDASTDVTLKRFERPGMEEYNIDRVVFRVFPDYSTLLTDIINVSAVRSVPRNSQGHPILPKNFTPVPYTLPQYVGLFFNLDRPIPGQLNVRIGLQRGTNKQEVIDAIHESRIVDTPLLELDVGDTRYSFDATAAQGAFFDSDWHKPEKLRLQRLLEQREANAVGPLANAPRVAYLSTGALLVLTGSTTNLRFPIAVNGFRVSTGTVVGLGMSGSVWKVSIPAGNGSSGSIAIGAHILKMTDAKGDIVDSAFIERIADAATYSRAAKEQGIVERFLTSKKLPPDDPQAIGTDDLFLDDGFLRLREKTDPIHPRVNARGEELVVHLLTSPKPESYRAVAEVLKKQWEALGARVIIDVPVEKRIFQEKMIRRDYDVLLFGQSLQTNLDSYSYWHSSQLQERSDASKLKLDAFNLSQYASFEADTLLEKIRVTGEGTSRERALQSLDELLRKDRPAIILYSPLAIFGHREDVLGVNLKNLSLHSDRFAGFKDWSVTRAQTFRSDRGWRHFIPWVIGVMSR